ncbi:Cof-type HAD-IIB family hydrolase [Sporosarcina sp. FSL K6-3457]|uniref:Cof-type HAD-IIB family hydrolase n=1 Tax=Sporosarcina sp. FSL K6-3457 TaxID=2978204 RepID=UPI0030F6773F
MEKKVVFFDLDGTLLNENKVVLESSKKAIRALQDKGIYTAISTGRSPLMFDWLLEELNISSYVSMNGQHVIFEGEEIYANPMDPDMIHDLSTIAQRNGDGLAYSNHQMIKVNAEMHPFIYPSYEGLRLDYPLVEMDFYKHSPVYQVQLYCERKDTQMYIQRYADYTFIDWGDYGSDVLPKGSSKAVGVQKMLEKLGVQKENSYAFGDGTNDFEMLAFVGTGIAMENAVPELKAQADFVTTSCSEDGILNGLVSVGLLESNIFENAYS